MPKKFQYDSKSPYANTPFKDFYLGIYVDRPIPASEEDNLIIVESKYEYRPDMLSYDLYGTAKYWWIFMRRNMDQIKDPVFGFTAGLEIYVPTNERLRELLGG